MITHCPGLVRNFVVAMLFAVAFVSESYCQDAGGHVPEKFDVLFTEYRIEGEIDFSMKPDWILASVLESKTKKDGTIKSVESVRMMAAENASSQIELLDQVLMGVRDDKANPLFLSYGITARITADNVGDKIFANIRYTSSEPGEKDKESGKPSPEEISLEIQTTVTLTPGKALIIGGRSGKESRIVAVTIE